MIYLINFLTLTLISFLTLSFLPNLRIFGVVPLLPLFFIIALSNYRKGFEPFLLAAFFGIIFDLSSSYSFGFYLILFLVTAALVRYMFQEGMRTLSFVSYIFLSLLLLAICIVGQVIFVALANTPISASFILPIVAFLGVNLTYAILIYAFSNWYFDRLASLEHELKRR